MLTYGQKTSQDDETYNITHIYLEKHKWDALKNPPKPFKSKTRK